MHGLVAREVAAKQFHPTVDDDEESGRRIVLPAHGSRGAQPIAVAGAIMCAMVSGFSPRNTAIRVMICRSPPVNFEAIEDARSLFAPTRAYPQNGDP